MFFSVRESFHLNPYPLKLISLTFHKLEVVSRYSDLQLQVAENYLKLTTNICKS